MERYIRENQSRDLRTNPNGWWDSFPPHIRLFYFLFVSGHFKGNYERQIERLQMVTGVKGAAIEIKQLLLAANRYRAGELSAEGLAETFFAAAETAQA